MNSVYNGTKTIPFLDPKVWDIIPSEITGKELLEAFKSAIQEIETRTLSNYVGIPYFNLIYSLVNMEVVLCHFYVNIN